MQTTLAQYNETQATESFALQNSKLLKVRLDQVTVQAKLGSMVAYQGEVRFDHKGGGLGRFFKKALTGEGVDLMVAAGNGDLFLAHSARKIMVLELDNERMTVNGENIPMDRAAFLEKGRTIVPLSFVGKALDVEVNYDPQTGRLQITSKK